MPVARSGVKIQSVKTGRVDVMHGMMGWNDQRIKVINITDPIYFERSLAFTIEHGHNNNLTLDLRSVAYWYQHEPHKVFEPLPDRETRRPRPFVGPQDIHRWRQDARQQTGDPQMWK